MTQTPSLPIGAARFAVATILLLPACQGGPDHPDVTVRPPEVTATEAVQMPGLHNVVTYGPDIVCGGVPEGREGLETLRAMGIKTIVSVDGQKPDAKTAEALGMRYVHLPISYDTVTPERQKELAQVLVNADQPIYMHCHHGKHRSAAALGSAVVLAGKMTPEQACERMSVSGTSPSYTGLWAAVREAKPLPANELQADISRFPSIAQVSGMVETMAEIDLVFSLVDQARDAGWRAPDDHPDLVPTKETKRLADLMAHLRDDPESQQLPADYQEMLNEAIDQTTELDRLVRAGKSAEAAKLLDAIRAGCKACHKEYRNK